MSRPAPVAVCVLTSEELMAPLALTPGVAIAGEVQTANLGGELAKAESALRLGVRVHYEQDRPLRGEAPDDAPTSQETGGPPPPSPPSNPLTWAQVRAATVGEPVDVTLVVTSPPAEHLLEGVLAEPVHGAFLRAYRRTDHRLRVRWSSETNVLMGTIDQFAQGA